MLRHTLCQILPQIFPTGTNHPPCHGLSTNRSRGQHLHKKLSSPEELSTHSQQQNNSWINKKCTRYSSPSAPTLCVPAPCRKINNGSILQNISCRKKERDRGRGSAGQTAKSILPTSVNTRFPHNHITEPLPSCRCSTHAENLILRTCRRKTTILPTITSDQNTNTPKMPHIGSNYVK
ncbi:hypothetical protein FHG87_020352 [Trinorchestia longiramus]|nr:hypothetical protein FHG87_020352 [Trinorchestia longiramus]